MTKAQACLASAFPKFANPEMTPKPTLVERHGPTG